VKKWPGAKESFEKKIGSLKEASLTPEIVAKMKSWNHG